MNPVLLFLALAFGGSWTIWMGAYLLEDPPTLLVASAMFMPALAALFVHRVQLGRPLRGPPHFSFPYRHAAALHGLILVELRFRALSRGAPWLEAP